MRNARSSLKLLNSVDVWRKRGDFIGLNMSVVDSLFCGFSATSDETTCLLESSRHTVEPPGLESAPLIPLKEVKLYKRRWVMLFIFSVYSMSNGFMWLQYGIISDIFVRFYNTSTLAINSLSMVFCFTYIPLILPVMWVLDKRGMRDLVVVGSAFNSIGAWIKTSTADPRMFTMTFFGQFVSSVATVFILSIPSKLASLWFGPQEVSTACSLGVLGNQVRL